MFKAQYKMKSPFESWKNIGSYSNERQAMNSALSKKNHGAVMVRVLDRKGGIVYTG